MEHTQSACFDDNENECLNVERVAIFPVIDVPIVYKTIGIRGTSPGCGKDTVMDLITKCLIKKGHTMEAHKFATPLRKVVELATGVPEDISSTVKGKNIISFLQPLTDESYQKMFEIITGIAFDKSKLNMIIIDTPLLQQTIAQYIEMIKYFFDKTFPNIEPLTIGQYLQKIGGLFRNIHSNVWVNATMNKLNNNVVSILGDVRFPNEQNAVKNRNGFTILVKSDRPLDPKLMAGRSINDASERALDNTSPDYIIENNGTLEELEFKVIQLINNLFSKSGQMLLELQRMNERIQAMPNDIPVSRAHYQWAMKAEELMKKSDTTDEMVKAHAEKLIGKKSKVGDSLAFCREATGGM